MTFEQDLINKLAGSPFEFSTASMDDVEVRLHSTSLEVQVNDEFHRYDEIQSLNDMNIATYNTNSDGTVIIKTDGKTFNITIERNKIINNESLFIND